MPFGWGESHDAYNEVYEGENRHEAKFSHELIAGGAAFAGFKLFEDQQRREGKPVSHAFAKELLAGVVGGEVDRLAEGKGEDWVDRERAKRHAKQSAERMYDEHYVEGQRAEEYDPNRYGAPERINRQYGNPYEGNRY